MILSNVRIKTKGAKKMPLNVKLLNMVKQHILDEPARLRMDCWLVKGPANKNIYTAMPGYNEPKDFTLPSCGTVGCIAGWAAILSAPKPEEINADSYMVRAEYAADTLGIDADFEPFDLFFCDQWPIQMREAYYEALSAEERAQIVARVIDQFILGYNDNKRLYDAS
jgi:hypothetical protein